MTTTHTLALLVPLGVVDVLLAGWRAYQVFDQGALDWQWWWRLWPITLFHLGVGALWLLWMHSPTVRRRPWLGYVPLHVYFTAMSALVVFNAAFFHYLDIQIEATVLGQIAPLIEAGIFTIIKAEVNPVFYVAAVLVIVVANMFPRIVIRILRLHQREAIPTGETHPRRARVVLIAAVVVLAVSWVLPDGLGTGRFTRERLPAVSIGVAQDALEGDPAPTPAEDLPLDTRLVPDGAAGAKPYNIVMIFEESQRANSVSYYNPDLDTTPEFDELARTSIVADHAYTAMPHTSKSLLTTHCGVAPPLDNENSEGKVGGVAARCLPLLLADRGYSTAFFQSPTKDFEHREQMVKNLGFQNFFPLESLDKTGFSKVNPLGYEDDIMVEPSVHWAKEQKSPFLLSYMTVTGHYDYTLPKGFKTEHYSDDETFNRYLNAVRYQDRFVGKVIESFKKAGLYDNTVFVVMGDHGEGFREHQRRIHNDTIWNEGIHIPLLIRVPGMTTKREITRPVVNTALLPTLVGLLGLKVEGGAYDFHSMLDPEPQPVITSCWDDKQCISIVEGDHKFIHFFDEQPDAYYDLATDPDETDNLIDELSEKQRNRYVSRMLSWVRKVDARYAVPHTPTPADPDKATP